MLLNLSTLSLNLMEKLAIILDSLAMLAVGVNPGVLNGPNDLIVKRNVGIINAIVTPIISHIS